MKRLFLFAAFFIVQSVFSQEMEFFIQPQISLKKAEYDEIFFGTDNHADCKKSLLEWNENNVMQLGFESRVLLSRFNFSLNFDSAIPMECGTMYDSDWLDESNISMKTTYSENKTRLIADTKLSFGSSFDFTPCSWLKISPVIEADYGFVSFLAHDGIGWYGDADKNRLQNGTYVPWNSPEARKAKIASIGYYRHLFSFFSGMRITFEPASRWHFSLEGMFSPFSYSSAMDTHYSDIKAAHINMRYQQIQSGSLTKFKLRFVTAYDLNKKLSLVFCVKSLFGKTEKGDLYVENGVHMSDGSLFFNKARQKSGASFYEINSCLGLKIRVL